METKLDKARRGRVVGGDKSGGLMIQSGGQGLASSSAMDRLPMYTAWAILGTLLALSLFFAIRGPYQNRQWPINRDDQKIFCNRANGALASGIQFLSS